MAFEEQPTEAEALAFKAEHDAQVEAAREGMGYKGKVEAPVEETEIETPVEAVDEPEEEVETEDTEEQDEDTEELESEVDTQPRDKSVFRQLNEIRSQKRAAEAEKETLLAEYNKVLEENKALKANQPPPEPFVEFAKSQGITEPKAVVDMFNLFKGELDKDFGARITQLDEKIQTYEANEVARGEQVAYSESMEKLTDEWSTVLPTIESEYKPDSKQLDDAFSLMADLAHDQKYHDKEIEYILFKEADKFEEIFGARKRRTMFSSKGRPQVESKAPAKRDGSHESIMALMREQKAKMNAGDGFSVVENAEI